MSAGQSIPCPHCHRKTPRKVDVNGRCRCRHCGHIWYLGKGLGQAGRATIAVDRPPEPGTGVRTRSEVARLQAADPLTGRVAREAAGISPKRPHLTPPERPPGTGTVHRPPIGRGTGTLRRRPELRSDPGPVTADLPPVVRSPPGSSPPAEPKAPAPVADLGLLDALAEEEHRSESEPGPASGSDGSDGGGRPADPLLGRVLKGCQIERLLGGGGMGRVYLARQLSLERRVALKVLSAELRGNRDFIRSLEREAKILGRINHVNIVHVYDFGEYPQLGVFFIIMEFVDGSDLTHRLRKVGRLPMAEAFDLMRQAAVGLDHAAQSGVIHRDIKPDNLMITNDGVCKVSDFGLATVPAQSGGGSARVGTPAFMSPEQCQGAPVDVRSDIYALGCTGFVACTGSLPYEADSPYELMLRHRTWPVPSAREVCPGLPEAADRILQWMMAKRPGERPIDMGEVVRAIDRLLGDGTTRTASGRITALDRPSQAPQSDEFPDWMVE